MCLLFMLCRSTAFPKGTRRKLPSLVFWNKYRSCVFIWSCQPSQIWCNWEIWIPFTDQCFKVRVSFHCISKFFLKANEAVGLFTADSCRWCELVTIPEHTELTGASSKAHEVTRMGTNTVFFQQIPYLLFLPVAYWTETINITWILAITEVSFIRFQDGVTRTLFTLFSSFSWKHKCSDVLKSFLMS